MNEFSKEVRSELLSSLPAAQCCRRALLWGLFFNAECGVGGAIYARLRGEEETRLAARLLREIYGRETEPQYENCYGKKIAEFSLSSEKLASALSALSGEDGADGLFACRACGAAYVKGVLLAASRISDPEREARLEIRVKDPSAVRRVSERVESLGVCPTVSNRGGACTLMLKRTDAIFDLLALAGAKVCAMKFMQSKLVREFRGEINRKSNCEIRNIERTADAARERTAAIRALKESGRFDALPEGLRTTAELCLGSPELSLSELAALHEPPLTKSGLNHRLAKIVSMARECRADEK